jgi:hypothetical protein
MVAWWRISPGDKAGEDHGRRELGAVVDGDVDHGEKNEHASRVPVDDEKGEETRSPGEVTGQVLEEGVGPG